MAPGGRRWSESPIPRVARRRVRVAKATAPVWSGFWGSTYADATTGAYDLGDLGGWLFGTPALSAGDVLVVVAGGRNTTITMPSGWTTLASGSAGGLDTVIGWRRLTGTDDFTGSVSPAYTAFPDYDGYADFAMLRWDATEATPSATLTMTAGATSASLVAPSGGVGHSNGWIVGRVANGESPVPSSTPSGSEIVSPDVINIGVSQLDASAPGVSSGSVADTASCDWGMWTLTWA